MSRDEIPAYVEAASSAFHNDVSEEVHERWERVLEPERTLVVRDRGRIVAGTGIFPAGSPFPAARCRSRA